MKNNSKIIWLVDLFKKKENSSLYEINSLIILY